ncbi:MAG: hypothetical protein ACXVJ7_00100 [Acidimicrobiia bacterium]
MSGGPPRDDGAARVPEEYLQGEGVTLLDVLDALRARGFGAQFGEADGTVRCFTCRTDSSPASVAVDEVRRLEGASDPADMLAVVALRCPHCGAAGALTLNYGPVGTPGEAAVLEGLPEPSAPAG